jgi:hypothetical protein
MKVSAPKVITWWIAVILGVVGVCLQLEVFSLPALTPYIFWLPVVGLALLALATLLKDL